MNGLVNRLSSFAPSRAGVRAAAFGGLFAVCCVLGPGEVEAKHAALGPAQDDETADSSTPPGNDRSGQSTVITGEIVETHDRLSPDVLNGIERVHSFQISLSGKNHVAETWTGRRIDMGGGRISRQGGKRNRFGNRAPQNENNATIGESGGNVVWHVLGEKKLQRIFAGQHFLLMMDIEIGPDNACRVDARYLRQTGFEAIVMRRADNGELANFSLPHVERASCAIH